jgi:aconitase A
VSTQSLDSFKSRKTLEVGKSEYVYFSLKEAEKNGLTGISSLPFSLKVLLENLLRFEDGRDRHGRPHPRRRRLAGDRRSPTPRSSSRPPA